MHRIEARSRRNVEAYFDAVAEKGLCRDIDKLRFQMDFLYGQIDFQDKAVLDIGGGSGIHSFYAACCGAREVVCLEPEASGSSRGVVGQFQELGVILECEHVKIEPISVQEFECGSKTFEIIILHDSINHLNEEACVSLLHDAGARSAYREAVAKIFRLSTEAARLVICDCSRYNFFTLLGIRNPFDPGIEWHKRQAPETWVNMLGDAGFVDPKITWSSPNRLRWWGRALLGNKCMAYFFTSHFRLVMDRRSS